MPDTIRTLYWWGYEPAAMGAVAHTNTDLSRTAPTLTSNTNSKTIYQPSASRGCAYYLTPTDATDLNIILSGSATVNNTYNSGYMGMNSVNTSVAGTDNTNFFNVYPRSTTSMAMTYKEHEIVNNTYIIIQITANSGAVTLIMNALWMNKQGENI